MASTLTLITVKRTDGLQRALNLDTSATLAETRTILGSAENDDMMRSTDSFLTLNGVEIEQSSETDTLLTSVLKDALLNIGDATSTSPIDPHDGVARYNLLSADARRAILSNVQIFRGITVTSDGFQKGFHDVYSLTDGQLPPANSPATTTELTSAYSFSKVTRDLNLFSSQSSSVSLSTPFASGDAEYKTEQSQSTDSSQVTEQLVTRYIVRKVLIEIDPSDLTINPNFYASLKSAIEGKERTLDGYYALLGVLNEWGYYFSTNLALGGMIYASDETQISDYSEAEANKEEFTGSFKASFDGIGGGAAYSQASGSSASTSSSTKFSNLTLQMVGGKPGLENDYKGWAASLDTAADWALIDTTQFRPTLLLLSGSSEGNTLLGSAINLIESYSANPSTIPSQPFLDMQGYNTIIQEAVNPFG